MVEDSDVNGQSADLSVGDRRLFWTEDVEDWEHYKRHNLNA